MHPDAKINQIWKKSGFGFSLEMFFFVKPAVVDFFCGAWFPPRPQMPMLLAIALALAFLHGPLAQQNSVLWARVSKLANSARRYNVGFPPTHRC